MKTLEALSGDEDEDNDAETVNTVLETLVTRVADQLDEQDMDDVGLAKRVAKRSLTSTVNSSSDTQQIKRLRSNAAPARVSV